MAQVRNLGSFLAGLLVLVLLGAIGVGIYDAGLQQGILQSADLPANAVPYYAYGYHGFGFGGGLLGLIFPILFLFLIFGLVRAAFRGGRGWGHHGYGYGPGRWGQGPATGDRNQWVADWHRRLHETDADASSGSGTSTASGPSGPSAPGQTSTDRPS
jgi:hypothetical protein